MCASAWTGARLTYGLVSRALSLATLRSSSSFAGHLGDYVCPTKYPSWVPQSICCVSGVGQVSESLDSTPTVGEPSGDDRLLFAFFLVFLLGVAGVSVVLDLFPFSLHSRSSFERRTKQLTRPVWIDTTKLSEVLVALVKVSCQGTVTAMFSCETVAATTLAEPKVTWLVSVGVDTNFRPKWQAISNYWHNLGFSPILFACSED